MKFSVTTRSRTDFVEITHDVNSIVAGSGLNNGAVVVFVPHTTAGITINENADPDVLHDVEATLSRLVPWSHRDYRHAEGNSAAHAKASLMGASATVIVTAGRLQLGTWQGLYLCEFDGPRTRQVWVQPLAVSTPSAQT